MAKIKVYESDGSDGYSDGTWGYTIRHGDGLYCDGGYSGREAAAGAAEERVAVLVASGAIES